MSRFRIGFVVEEPALQFVQFCGSAFCSFICFVAVAVIVKAETGRSSMWALMLKRSTRSFCNITVRASKSISCAFTGQVEATLAVMS